MQNKERKLKTRKYNKLHYTNRCFISYLNKNFLILTPLFIVKFDKDGIYDVFLCHSR